MEDGEIKEDLGELVNIFGRKHLGFQYPSGACGAVGEFARWGEVARSLRNGRMVRRASIGIADISSRAESDPMS